MKERVLSSASTPFKTVKRGLSALILSASAVLSPVALADMANTTGLAVTDDTVTVGILHSLTGTMAISETGAQEAE